MPGSIAGLGLIPSIILGFCTHNLTNFLVLEGIFITGGLALWASLWQTQYLAQQNEQEIFDSLRRSILRQLQVPYYPEFLDKLLGSGISRLDLKAPISIAHLVDSIDIAAKNPQYEKLYTVLLEVRKLIDHLNFLQMINPQIAVSPWAMTGLNIVRLEMGFTEGLDEEQQLALYRYYKILVDRSVDEAKYKLSLDEFLNRAEKELTGILETYQTKLESPPELTTESTPNAFQKLQNTLHARPTNMAQDIDNLKAEARRLRDSWSKSKVDQDEHSHN
jgi:hypothetical protein